MGGGGGASPHVPDSRPLPSTLASPTPNQSRLTFPSSFPPPRLFPGGLEWAPGEFGDDVVAGVAAAALREATPEQTVTVDREGRVARTEGKARPKGE